MIEKKIILLMPSYFEYDNVLILREKINKIFDKFIPESERFFYIIDDSGQIDQEILEVRRFNDSEVIQTPFNIGHQRALVFGLRSLIDRIHPNDIIITMDADGQDTPESLLNLVKPLLEKKYDKAKRISLAQRTFRCEGSLFITLYNIFKIFFRIVTGIWVKTGNFAAFRGQLLANIINHPYFDMCYSSSLLNFKLDIFYIPCKRGHRIVGKGRMNYTKLISHGLRMLIPFIDRIFIRILIFVTSLLALASVLTGSIISFGHYSLNSTPTWIILTTVLIFLTIIFGLSNFLILFFLYYNSQGLYLRGLEKEQAIKYKNKSDSKFNDLHEAADVT